jgi:hypothetical protein
MPKSIILAAMVFALCVARFATFGSGEPMQGEGLVMAAPVSQSA